MPPGAKKILAAGHFGIEKGRFLFDFGAEYAGEGEYLPSYIYPCCDNEYGTDYIMYTPYKKVKLTDGQELAKVAEPYFNRTAQHFCSHKHTPSAGISDNSGIDLKLKTGGAVMRVYLAAQNKDLEFVDENGYTYARGITVNCHQMAVFDDRI